MRVYFDVKNYFDYWSEQSKIILKLQYIEKLLFFDKNKLYLFIQMDKFTNTVQISMSLKIKRINLQTNSR